MLFSISIGFLPRAQASFFDFVEKIIGSSDTSSKGAANSQTLPLLSAPLNQNLLAGQGGGDITVVGDSALLPATGPLGSIADVVEHKPDSISLYVVRDGDTLSSIAKIFDVSVNTIIWSNNLKRGSLINSGDVLVILPVSGVQYVIKKGDTLKYIAKKYGGDAAEILAFNGLASAKDLKEGLVLIIPNGEGEPIPSSSGGRIARGGGPNYAGYYLRPITGGRKSQGLHGYNGVDLASYCGAPVFASASGDVIIARPFGWNGGYGQYVVISHPNGTQTLYGHLSAFIVSPGWHVVQGQIIGYVGSTGLSTGCHVHFEVRGARNPF
ncbi:MAG: peptidoglycan DD-metalloendopeptidase family protein [bacterium]|nr:peptidoglycan DD-metalloendopeptidase family protein [bacterium]